MWPVRNSSSNATVDYKKLPSAISCTICQFRMKLRACCGVLDKIAATRYAAKWDNVGLLVEPANCHVKRIYLTNDLTEAVMDEAIAYGANLIISYHPPLFTSFKRISQNNWKDRLVTQALKHDIAIYSPHTAHDAWKDGVNSWLIKASGIEVFFL